MSLSFIYYYIFHPLESIEKAGKRIPTFEAWFVLLLAAISAFSQTGLMVSTWSLLLIFILFTVQTISLFLQSTFLDFFSQLLFRYKSQSLLLFYWLALSLLPFLGLVPLNLLNRIDWVATLGLIDLANVGLVIWVCILQIITVKKLYSASTLHSLILYFLPLIIIFAIAMMIMILSLTFLGLSLNSWAL